MVQHTKSQHSSDHFTSLYAYTFTFDMCTNKVYLLTYLLTY